MIGLEPEYNFSPHEIDMVNRGTVHVLERDWLKRTGNLAITEIQYVDSEESERLSQCGSSYNTIVDFNHAQELDMSAQTNANDYAYGVKHKVDRMYEEVFAANSYPDGPEKYFEDLKRQVEKVHTFKSRLLGLISYKN